MEQRLTIISLGVKDLKAAAAFYQTCFGWKLASSSTEDIKFFQLNGILLSLYPVEKIAQDAEVVINNVAGYGPNTLAHNARSEEEVNRVIEELRSKGVNIVKEPQKVFWGGYSSYVSDLDGNLWEIAYNPYLPLDEKGNILDSN